jgi:hypothetical protein
MFAAYMANDLEPDFNQLDIPRCRKHIALSITKHAEIDDEIKSLLLKLHDEMVEEAKSTLCKSGLPETVVDIIIPFLGKPH